jgi:hypothetical protein
MLKRKSNRKNSPNQPSGPVAGSIARDAWHDYIRQQHDGRNGRNE